MVTNTRKFYILELEDFMEQSEQSVVRMNTNLELQIVAKYPNTVKVIIVMNIYCQPVEYWCPI